MKLVLIFVSLVVLGSCSEHSVSINFKNVINTISERFISYEVKFADLVNLFREKNSMDSLNLISPSYLKLHGFSSYIMAENKDFNKNELTLMFKSLE